MLRDEVAVVTGSSTGIGFETSLILARNGFHTYATMHRLEGGKSEDITNVAKNENIPLQAIQLDVDSDRSVLDAINAIMSERERIDIVINNAGYALAGPFEETSMDEIRAQFETNFFGPV
ncbi:MAG: SDR family NAD(P)-dependent oxidoreductase, partial [Thermoproteota archaeon]|nr:SDR family NAD(P)-dependent oxidoreductase [Thermoproteota archaeon]